ncbi:ABC-F family ATP-binding cassette domain-containing protein [Streptomyces sp. NPDC002889]|uniref:ABC-F family ATP-binding cassette domain-containing protein n=1 Tax=Streptomyces sp. NPDC002889 TaxID=3364669 RepID=UPI0036C36AB9
MVASAPVTTAVPQITLADVTKRYDDRIVFDRVSFTLRPGEKVGVVGENGSGKSTLLRLLAGQEEPDNGRLTVVAPGGIGHLAQRLDLPGSARVGHAIDLALTGLRRLERRIRAAEAGLQTAGEAGAEEYARLVAEFEARGGYDADRKVAMTLRRLGEREPLDLDRRLGTLSGGRRSRLALAAALASSPELLLLDEPTNDLDDEAVGWLEEQLHAHHGTVVAVTHDRVFLERVTSTVLEVDQDRRTVRRHGNGYAGFLAAKAADRARWISAHEDWRADVARQSRLATANIGLLSAIPRKAPAAFSGAGAFRARSRAHGAMSRIRNARERLQRLTSNPVPPPPQPLRFTAGIEGEAAGGVALSGVEVPGRLTLDGLEIPPGGRLLVTGPNGAGKSTLLQVLAGELVPAAGTVTRPSRVGFLRQSTQPVPDGRTVLQAYGEERAEMLSATGLFHERDFTRAVRALSTGQRRRLELALLVAEPVHLMLLDEPTNHLSPALVEELEAALAGYPGTLVVVTHDRRMRGTFDGPELVVGDAEGGGARRARTSSAVVPER